MFGFILGAASLIGLAYLLKGGRCGRHHTHRRGWGPGGGRRRWRRRKGIMVDRLVDHLDADDVQERALREAADELFGEARTVRSELGQTRGDIAQALRDAEFDAESLTSAFARQDATLEDLRRVAIGALAKVHAVLDPSQRERLAAFLERRDKGGPPAGPYRTAEV